MKKISLSAIAILFALSAFCQSKGIDITNKASGGAIGTAAATVDKGNLFNVFQSTAGQTLTLPAPTVKTTGRTLYEVRNLGSVSFTLVPGGTLDTAQFILLSWTGNPGKWVYNGTGAVSGGGASLTQSVTNGDQTHAPSADAVYDFVQVVQGDIDDHIANTSNPHSVTKAQVGLPLADNTADASKPVSALQQAALDLKVDKSGSKVLSDENYSSAEKSKLSGIATGATANSSDATLLDRSNHTGNQAISTVTNLQTTLDNKLESSSFTDALISTSDITTNNATTSKHGFLKKLSGSSTEYMNGAGNWSTPAGGGSADSSTFVTRTNQKNTVNNQVVGVIFSDLMNTANYTKVATSGSQTFGSNLVTLTGGNNTFTANLMSYNYNSLGTLLENYTISSKFISTANSTGSYGYGIGITQVAGVALTVMINTNAAGSRGVIYVMDANAGTLLATSTSALSYTNSTDTIQLEFRFAGLHLQAVAKNLSVTTRDASGTTIPNVVTLDYDFTGTNRVGKPVMYTHGGTQVVYNFSMKTDEFQNPKIILMGDSRVTFGGCGTSLRRRYADLFGASTGQKAMVWAKGGATVATLNSCFPEVSAIIKGQPTYIIPIIGINDAILARTLAQYKADYLTLLQNISAAGGIPVVSKIAYVGTSYSGAAAINLRVDSINSFIGGLPFRQFDENTPTKTGIVLTSANACDEIHYSDLGNRVIAEAMKSQLNSLYKHSATWVNDGTYNYTSSPVISGRIQLSPIVSSSTYHGVYFGNITPSATNFSLDGDGTDVVLNAPTGSIFLRAANTGFGGGTSLFTAVGSTGNVSVGPPATNQRLFGVNQGGYVSMGSLFGSSTIGAIYIQTATPSATNYSIYGDGTNLSINSPLTSGVVSFNTGGNNRGIIGTANWQYYNTVQTTGNPTQFYWSASANTAQTAGAGFTLFYASASSIQHASNTAVSNDKAFLIRSPAIAFATAGGTSTNPAGLKVYGPSAGTNATLVNPLATSFIGNSAISGSLIVGDSVTAPSSTLQSLGSFAANYATTATNLTLTSAHYFVNVTATATITLPTAVGITGRVYIIKSTTGTTTMATTSAQTIDGSAPGTVTGQMRLISDGAGWLTF